VIADRWHVPPFAIDDWPAAEVRLELQLMGIEAQAQAKRRD
jgi:hypothetical protein